MAKYIKGKDGKFRGSVPDASAAPQPSPILPQQPESLVRRVKKEDGSLEFYETREAFLERMRASIRAGFS